MEASLEPLTGLYKPHKLSALYYGPSIVQNKLLSCLPSETSKAFIVTGTSLATKTPLIKQVEDLLTSKRHAATFSDIKQHVPIDLVHEAVAQVERDSSIDTLISIGGGSPIDAAKAINYFLHQQTGNLCTHISIPTTLSAAECTFSAGYKAHDGSKPTIKDPILSVSHIFYDATFALYTPPTLFLSTGFRALDHAVESQTYAPATLIPCRVMTLDAIRRLFTYLPLYKQDPSNHDVLTHLFLAAFASLAFLGANTIGPLGISHTLGYALGSPYAIPHGITSCLTLGHVVKLKARSSDVDAASLAAILPVLGKQRTGDDVGDAETVGDMILTLVREMGLATTLTEKGVGRDQVDVIVERAMGWGQDHGRGKVAANEGVIKGIRGLVEALF